MGVPQGGIYDEVFNSDSDWYGGSNFGNAGSLQAVPHPHNNRPHSLILSLPPLATIVLKPRR